MKPIMLALGVFALFFGGTLWYQETAHICPVPIAYRIGEVDERFGITPEAVQEIAAEAEAAWESAVGEQLFLYDASSAFPINLIYDERQQMARTEEEWRVRLDAAEADNEEAVQAVTQQREAYTAQEVAYQAERERYESRLASYNNEVAQYNATGGAPAAEYERLQTEAAALNAAAQELSAMEDQLRQLAEALNEAGVAVNENIEAYNDEVRHYNELFGESETFTQGDFKRDRINVYKFSSPAELTAVLVHEFGHALGIGHVEDETAIMYHLMTERDSSTLAAADKEAFFAACGDTSGIASDVRRIIRTIVAYIN